MLHYFEQLVFEQLVSILSLLERITVQTFKIRPLQLGKRLFLGGVVMVNLAVCEAYILAVCETYILPTARHGDR